MNKIGGIWNDKQFPVQLVRSFSALYRQVFRHSENLVLYSNKRIGEQTFIYDGEFYDGELSDFEATFDPEFLPQGKYAIVRWEKDNNTLVLLRDRAGICPLYYLVWENAFAFASDIRDLITLLPKKYLNYSSAFDLLALNHQGKEDETLIQSIYELDPNKSLIIDLASGKLTFQVRKQVPVNRRVGKFNRQKFRDRCTKLQYLLNGSIRARMEKSKALGVLLSGGLDSSVLSALIHRNLRKDQFFELFTAGFPGTRYDESKYAKIVHQHLSGTQWNLVLPEKKDFLKDLEKLHSAIAIPTLSVGSYLQYRLIQAAKSRGMEKLFDGTGADALFAGHWHHKMIRWREMITHLQLTSLLEHLKFGDSFFKEMQQVFKMFLKTYAMKALPASFQIRINRYFYEDWKYLNREFLYTYKDRIKRKTEEFHSSLNPQIYHEYFHGEVRHLLHYPVNISRYFEIDLINPFSDNMLLARTVFSWPSNMKSQGGHQKYILREAFREILPGPIYRRKGKMGLVSPNNEWITELKNDFRPYFTSHNSDIFDLHGLMREYDRIFELRYRPENYRMFKLISFVVWRDVWNIE